LATEFMKKFWESLTFSLILSRLSRPPLFLYSLLQNFFVLWVWGEGKMPSSATLERSGVYAYDMWNNWKRGGETRLDAASPLLYLYESD